MRVALISMGFLVAVATAGCSDDTTTPQGGGIKAKIAMLAPFSGTLEGFGKSLRNAVNMAINELKKASAVDFELKTWDTQTDPVQAEKAAKEVIADKDFVAVIGPAASGEALKVIDIFKGEKLVAVSPSATSPALTTAADEGTFWRTIPSDKYQGVVAGEYGFDTLKKKTAGVLYIDNTYGKGLADAFKETFEKKAGAGAVKAMVAYPDMTDPEVDAYDFTPKATELFKDKPELIFLITYFKDGAKFTIKAKDFLTGGYAPAFLGCDGNYGSDFYKNCDQAVCKDMIGTAPSAPEGDPNFKAFRDAYKTQFGGNPEPYAESAYDAAMLIGLAVYKAGKADRTLMSGLLRDLSNPPPTTASTPAQLTQILADLKAGKDINYDGASGAVDWDANGDVTKGIYLIWQITQGASGVEAKTIGTKEVKVE